MGHDSAYLVPSNILVPLFLFQSFIPCLTGGKIMEELGKFLTLALNPKH